jgi:hypothetical protein
VGDKRQRKNKIYCVAGDNVNYVKPDRINVADLSKEIIFTFRVKNPDRRVLIQLKDETNRVIYKRKKRYVIPSEMIELSINLKEHDINPTCSQITVECIPRPEPLIDEED